MYKVVQPVITTSGYRMDIKAENKYIVYQCVSTTYPHYHSLRKWDLVAITIPAK